MGREQVKVLVVDDYPDIRGTLSAILEMEGFHIATAESGEQAVAMATAEPFNVVLMDVGLPGIDGVEAFRRIKKAAPHTAVIIMTAYAVPKLLQEARAEGALAALQKPFNIDELITLIEQTTFRFGKAL